jgi:hypothetical protein
MTHLISDALFDELTDLESLQGYYRVSEAANKAMIRTFAGLEQPGELPLETMKRIRSEYEAMRALLNVPLPSDNGEGPLLLATGHFHGVLTPEQAQAVRDAFASVGARFRWKLDTYTLPLPEHSGDDTHRRIRRRRKPQRGAS